MPCVPVISEHSFLCAAITEHVLMIEGNSLDTGHASFAQSSLWQNASQQGEGGGVLSAWGAKVVTLDLLISLWP